MRWEIRGWISERDGLAITAVGPRNIRRSFAGSLTHSAILYRSKAAASLFPAHS